MTERFKTIDEYIKNCPDDVQEILQTVRRTIRMAAPEATETISYQMPTYKYKGKNLVHFAAWKSHIGFYPTPSGTEEFDRELSSYKRAKGSVQFPLDKPMPLDLIARIVTFRVKEIEAKARGKGKTIVKTTVGVSPAKCRPAGFVQSILLCPGSSYNIFFELCPRSPSFSGRTGPDKPQPI